MPKLLRAAAVAFRIPFCLSSLHVLRGSLDMEPVSALLLGPLTTPGLLHPKSAQLMNKIGEIRDELLHVKTSRAAVAFLAKCSRVKYERFAPYPSGAVGGIY